jgi:hypothetical protein
VWQPKEQKIYLHFVKIVLIFLKKFFLEALIICLNVRIFGLCCKFEIMNISQEKMLTFYCSQVKYRIGNEISYAKAFWNLESDQFWIIKIALETSLWKNILANRIWAKYNNGWIPLHNGMSTFSQLISAYTVCDFYKNVLVLLRS